MCGKKKISSNQFETIVKEVADLCQENVLDRFFTDKGTLSGFSVRQAFSKTCLKNDHFTGWPYGFRSLASVTAFLSHCSTCSRSLRDNQISLDLSPIKEVIAHESTVDNLMRGGEVTTSPSFLKVNGVREASKDQPFLKSSSRALAKVGCKRYRTRRLLMGKSWPLKRVS